MDISPDVGSDLLKSILSAALTSEASPTLPDGSFSGCSVHGEYYFNWPMYFLDLLKEWEFNYLVHFKSAVFSTVLE
jgi:hypothetical protein